MNKPQKRYPDNPITKIINLTPDCFEGVILGIGLIKLTFAAGIA
jgi:hypothetical protein